MSGLLLTGFDAFGGVSRNPSQDIVESLAGSSSTVTAQVLPTAYRRSFAALLERMAQHQPESILMLGVAPGLACCRLELQAANRLCTRKADNDGFIPEEMMIDGDAPLTLATRLDVYQLHHDLGKRGVAVTLSQDCGNYVCNALYFRVLRYLRLHGLNSKALFVHVPNIYDGAEDENSLQRLCALQNEIAQIITLLGGD